MTITTWWRRWRHRRHARAYELGRADALDDALAAVRGSRDGNEAAQRILQIIESDHTTRERAS